MYQFEDNCARCGELFVNNSGCTSFGCENCDEILKATEAVLHFAELKQYDEVERIIARLMETATTNK